MLSAILTIPKPFMRSQVGVRRIGIRFIDDGVLQWVPMDWLSPSWTSGGAGEILPAMQLCSI